MNEFIQNADEKELFSKESWLFLTKHMDYRDSVFNHFILPNYKKFIPQVEEIHVIQKFEDVMSFYIWRWGKKLQKEKAKEKLQEKTIPYKGRVIAAGLVRSNTDNFKNKPNEKNKDALLKSVMMYSTFDNLNWEKLQAAASAVSNTYEKHKDKTIMENAISWADKSIETNVTLTNHYIKAKILEQLGEHDKAIKSINNAIEIALIGETYNAYYISISDLEKYIDKLGKDKNAL